MLTTIGKSLKPNALIKVAVLDRISTDPTTHQSSLSTNEFEVRAYLHFDRPPPKDFDRPQPGNQSAIWVEGHVTEVVSLANSALDLPPTMPQGKYAGIPARVLRSPDRWLPGKFWLTPRLSSGAIIQFNCYRHVGEKLWGWFVMEGVQ
jgi:hypothetical protein